MPSQRRQLCIPKDAVGVLPTMERYVLRLLRRLPTRYFKLCVKFWAVCAGHNVGTLAANTAFWTVFSLPWLILAIASTLGVVSRLSTPAAAEAVRQNVDQIIADLVGSEVAAQYAAPAFDQIFNQGLRGLGVVGYVVAFYSGSRAVSSCMSGIALVSGAGDVRREVRARLLAIVLYLVGVVLFVVALTTTTVGTDQVAQWSGIGEAIFNVIDAVLLAVAGIAFLWTIYHFAVYPRLPWKRDLPAAVAALVITVLCVYFVAWYAESVASSSSFGALVIAPFVAMLTAYVAFLMVLYIAVFSSIVNGRDVFNFDFGPRRAYHHLQSVDLADRTRGR